MKHIMTTKNGVKLYEDENNFYSENPSDVMNSLYEDSNNRNDIIASIVSTEILEDIFKKGGIKPLKKGIFFFVSSEEEDGDLVVTILSSSPKRALNLAIMNFVKNNYKGSPVLL